MHFERLKDFLEPAFNAQFQKMPKKTGFQF